MLMLLSLPLTLLRIGYYALWALADVLRGRSRMRVEKTVEIGAPREAVWQLLIAQRVVFDGPPVVEMVTEPLSEDPNLGLTRVSIGGHEYARAVVRELERNEITGTIAVQQVPHELNWPPDAATDAFVSMKVAATPQGTALTMLHDLTPPSFRHRINHALAFIYADGIISGED